MRIRYLPVLLLLVWVAPHVLADEPAPVVQFHFERQAKPDEAKAAQLAQLARQLLESSNFNTVDHTDRLQQSVPKVHQRYRQAVSGNHLIVTYDHPLRVQTVGGEIEVFEIVVGLARVDYASALFAVDVQGRVVGHEKYSGLLAIRVRDAAAGD
jgi:hypothetical protein